MDLTPFYQDDLHTFYLGDAAELIPKLQGAWTDMWTDPPWNEGINTLFRKWADRPDDDMNLAATLLAAVDAAILTPGYWWIEFSRRDQPLLHALQDPRLPKWSVYDCKQSPDGEARMFTNYTTLPSHELLNLAHHRLHDHILQLPQKSRRWIPEPRTWFDPFMGYGGFNISADRLGIRTIGIELNEKRLAKAVKELHADRYNRQGSA